MRSDMCLCLHVYVEIRHHRLAQRLLQTLHCHCHSLLLCQAHKAQGQIPFLPRGLSKALWAHPMESQVYRPVHFFVSWECARLKYVCLLFVCACLRCSRGDL